MAPRFRITLLLLAGVLTVAGVPARAQTAQEERVAASILLALGRAASPAEIDEWAARGPATVSDLMALHRQQIQRDAVARRAVAEKAGQDAFGLAPGAGPAGVLPGEGTYAELVQRHLVWLAEHPDEYGQMVHRAYRLVLARDAYSIEVEYWARQPPLSFALLAGCIEDWARRNQPGLMATTGVAAVSVNSRYLATVRLSPAVAAETRATLGLTPAGGAALAAATGRHVAAPGAAHVASVGGVHFAAVGGAALLSGRQKG